MQPLLDLISEMEKEDHKYAKTEEICINKERELHTKMIKSGRGDDSQYTKVVNGTSGMEIRLPLLLSEGVSKGRISMNKVCEITSTNIAKLSGCYPQKGIIAPGSDADVVLIDLGKYPFI